MTKAKEIVRTEFEHSYKYRDDLDDCWPKDEILADTKVCIIVTITDLYRICSLDLQNHKTTASESSTNIFDDLPSLQPPDAMEPEDELEKFLSTERDLKAKDGLRWWVERKHIYPRLYRMALDYLSIPGK